MKPDIEDVFVSPPIALTNRLRNGAVVTGFSDRGQKGITLTSIETVNDLPVDDWKKLRKFDDLTPVHPHRRIEFGPGSSDPSMRIVDLIAPIGLGQRALVVAPPRSGKTRLLSQMAQSISTNHPETKLVVLLLDERPEELTEAIRSIKGQVFGSTSDEDTRNHIHLATLALDYARRWAEAGADVVLFLDSLTRLGRSANLAQSGPGRTLSGGVDARALDLPRRVFGAARETEEAGSVTIVATALIDTNSRMDDFIYQDFKGTGNCEIVLRRELAESRIFPAIDLKLSGTRNEEILLGKETESHNRLRRILHDLSPIEAMTTLLKLVGNSADNAELLGSLK
jgi:transcription termination factor Rho